MRHTHELLRCLAAAMVFAMLLAAAGPAAAQSGYQVIQGTRVYTVIDQGRGIATFSNECGSQTLTQSQLQAGAIPNQIIPCPRGGSSGAVQCTGGRSCPAGHMCINGGRNCLPLNSPRVCPNGRYCDAGFMCTNNNQCLSQRSERMCSDGRYCDAGYMCTNEGKCLSTSDPSYCGGGRYCAAGSVCMSDGTCQSEEARRAIEEHNRQIDSFLEESRRRMEESDRQLRQLEENSRQWQQLERERVAREERRKAAFNARIEARRRALTDSKLDCSATAIAAGGAALQNLCRAALRAPARTIIAPEALSRRTNEQCRLASNSWSCEQTTRTQVLLNQSPQIRDSCTGEGDLSGCVDQAYGALSAIEDLRGKLKAAVAAPPAPPSFNPSPRFMKLTLPQCSMCDVLKTLGEVLPDLAEKLGKLQTQGMVEIEPPLFDGGPNTLRPFLPRRPLSLVTELDDVFDVANDVKDIAGGFKALSDLTDQDKKSEDYAEKCQDGFREAAWQAFTATEGGYAAKVQAATSSLTTCWKAAVDHIGKAVVNDGIDLDPPAEDK